MEWHWPILDSSSFFDIYLQLNRPNYVTKITDLSTPKLALAHFSWRLCERSHENTSCKCFFKVFGSLAVYLDIVEIYQYILVYNVAKYMVYKVLKGTKSIT